jgi:hypothetical protein
MIQNRDACNILIECEICNNKQFLGATEIHEILRVNSSETIKTKEFDKVSFLIDICFSIGLRIISDKSYGNLLAISRSSRFSVSTFITSSSSLCIGT